MKKLLLPLLIVGLFSCAEDVPEENASEPTPIELDQTDPKNVMDFIFQAAASGDYSNLEKLCIEQAESNKYTQMICFIAQQDTSHQSSFTEHFQNAHVVGEPRIKDDLCEVTFNFGPKGEEKDETMKLVRIDNKWYLQSF